MSKITSSNGNTYSTLDVSRDAFGLTDESGNTSVYAFEGVAQALEHIDGVENGTTIDAGNFGNK